VASAVNLIVAQRLVRRLFECKQEHKYTDERSTPSASPRRSAKADVSTRARVRHLQRVGVQGPPGVVRGHGHDQRGAAHGLEGRIDRGAREQAVKDGMLTLRMDGMLKVKRGITTLEEVVKETAA